jgi:hypothetical protein
MAGKYITAEVQTSVGKIDKVSTTLNFSDHLGSIKVRWSIGRDNYKVEPGLYAIGNPDEKSDVFVTANYKLSFDHLRKNLDDLDAWILVLDTKGVNVWCAAGKKTFGTDELVHRILITGLDKVVSHRKIIVPQLGAVGVSAHKVKEETENANQQSGFASNNSLNIPTGNFQLKRNQGFNVVYGPVRASDIKVFIANGYKTTDEMRRVTFNFVDRVKLIPVDFMYGKYKLLVAFALVFILAGLNRSGISIDQTLKYGFIAIFNIFLAYFAGIVLIPALLPYIPFRMFAFKGLILGLLTSIVLNYFNFFGHNYLEIISWFLIIPGIASFVAMNFTGSSTYTSLSGVKKEMKLAIPVQISFAVMGLILMIIGKLI